MFLEETEGKAIIWAHYQYDITAIIKLLKKYGPKDPLSIIMD